MYGEFAFFFFDKSTFNNLTYNPMQIKQKAWNGPWLLQFGFTGWSPYKCEVQPFVQSQLVKVIFINKDTLGRCINYNSTLVICILRLNSYRNFFL